MKLKLAILPLCLIVLNAFGFEGTVRQTVKNYNGTGTDVTMTWYLGGHSCRVDMTAMGKDNKSSNTVLLMDPATATLRTYDAGAAGQKVYFQLPTSAISASLNDINVTKTTDTRQIQGFKCEKWTVTTGGNSYDVWITRDIDFDAAAYRDFFKAGIEVQALAQQGVKGFPMLTESRSGANAASVEKVTAQTISAATFSIPSDYTLYVPQQAAKPATPKK